MLNLVIDEWFWEYLCGNDDNNLKLIGKLILQFYEKNNIKIYVVEKSKFEIKQFECFKSLENYSGVTLLRIRKIWFDGIHSNSQKYELIAEEKLKDINCPDQNLNVKDDDCYLYQLIFYLLKEYSLSPVIFVSTDGELIEEFKRVFKNNIQVYYPQQFSQFID